MDKPREGLLTIRPVANGWILMVSSSTVSGEMYDCHTLVYNTIEDLCEGLTVFYTDELEEEDDAPI